jgi:hypothetical protein
MSEHPPRIRIHAQNGALLIRDGLSITFYMCHPHETVTSAVMSSLEAYLHAVGPNALGLYADQEGFWQTLDDAGWTLIRNKLLNPRYASVHLADASGRENRYHFAYRGKPPQGSFLAVTKRAG